MKTFRTYRAQYAGWTHTKPSRVIITNMQTGERATVTKDTTTEATAADYLKSKGVQIDGVAFEDKTGHTIFISSGPYVDIRKGKARE